MPQFFITRLVGDVFCIEGKEAHHLINSLRVKIGEKIRVIHGDKSYFGIVEDIKYKCVKGRVLTEIKREPKGFYLHLFQSLISPNNFELVLRKATELGVDEFTPIITQRTQVKSEKYTRWEKIIYEAVKQSLREKIPKLNHILPFNEAVKLELELKIIAYENEITNIKDIFLNQKPKSVGIYIGPEGGFTEDEIMLAKKHNIIPISLGNYILRSETAAITSVAIVSLLLS